MRKLAFILSFVVSFVVLSFCILGCDGDSDDTTPPPAEVTSLVSASVTTAPTVDGVGGDAAWTSASTFVVTLENPRNITTHLAKWM